MSYRRIQAFWDRYWFRLTDEYQYGLFRIVFLMGAILANRRQFVQAPDFPPHLSDPPFFIRLLHLPFPPSLELFETLSDIHLCLLFFAIVGLFTRVSLICLTAVEIYLASYINSFDIYFHNSAVPDLVLLVLAFAPGATAYSLDARLFRLLRRKCPKLRGKFRNRGSSRVPAWPANLILMILALNYCGSGLAKLRFNSSWNSGQILQYHLVGPLGTYFTGPHESTDGLTSLEDLKLDAFTYDLRRQTDIGRAIASHEPWTRLLSIATVLFEVSFPLALFSTRLRTIYLLGGSVFHLGVFMVMRLNFVSFLFCYCVFIDWRRAAESCERLIALARRNVNEAQGGC